MINPNEVDPGFRRVYEVLISAQFRHNFAKARMITRGVYDFAVPLRTGVWRLITTYEPRRKRLTARRLQLHSSRS
jgi:hypothetical protein